MDNSKRVPSWSGQATEFEEYKAEARLYVAGTKTEQRHYCGARLLQQLTGEARLAALPRLREIEAAGEKSAEVLLALLEKNLGRPAVSSLAQEFDTFFHRLRRRKGESVAAWGLRFNEQHIKLRRALTRVTGTGTSAAGTRRASMATDNSPGGGGAQGSGWRGWYDSHGQVYDHWQPGLDFVDSRGRTQATEGSDLDTVDFLPQDELPQVIPAPVEAWLLLSKAGLTLQERASVLAGTQGRLVAREVLETMRSQFPDSELRDRDEHQLRRGRGKAFYQEMGLGDDADTWYAGHDDDEEEENESAFWGDPEDVWGEDPEAAEALAAAIQAKRTLKDAHQFLKEKRLGRRFFSPSSSPSGKGTGKGGSGGHFRPTGKASGSKGQSKGGKGKVGPCFRCGAEGHRARDCPDKSDTRLVGSAAVADNQGASQDGYTVLFISGEVYSAASDMMHLQVIDSGATATLGSCEAVDVFWGRLQERCPTARVLFSPETKPTFRFGNGATKACCGQATFFFSLGGSPVQFEVNVIDAPGVPLLLSARTMSALKAQLSFDSSRLTVGRLQRAVDLRRSPGGHYLLDFVSLVDSGPSGHGATQQALATS